MVLSATAPTSYFAPLIYIQSRSEKLTAILKKRRKVRYKIILVAAVLLMMALIRELKNMEADNE